MDPDIVSSVSTGTIRLAAVILSPGYCTTGCSMRKAPGVPRIPHARLGLMLGECIGSTVVVKCTAWSDLKAKQE